jgi:transposase-like protein
MFEVLIESIKRKWWKKYRRGLEQRFRQDEIVVLAIKIKKL